MKSALGTMATSLMRPVNPWRQQLNTAVQYLMVRLVLSVLSYVFLLTVGTSWDRKHNYTFPLVVIMPSISLVSVREKELEFRNPQEWLLHLGASEMVHWVKEIATNPENLSSGLRWKEKTISYRLSYGRPIAWACWHTGREGVGMARPRSHFPGTESQVPDPMPRTGTRSHKNSKVVTPLNTHSLKQLRPTQPKSPLDAVVDKGYTLAPMLGKPDFWSSLLLSPIT